MPNSVLWVCLVAIWLFVLIPMVIQGRPGLRKSTPVAAATRVLKRGEDAVRRRRGVGSGAHPHDPDYKPKDKHARATAAKVAAAEKAKSDVSSQDSPEAKPVVTAENRRRRSPTCRVCRLIRPVHRAGARSQSRDRPDRRSTHAPRRQHHDDGSDR